MLINKRFTFIFISLCKVQKLIFLYRFYSISKFGIALILGSNLICQSDQIMHWLTILELHSIVAYFYYTKLYHSLNNIEIVLEIAESLNHAIQFEEGHFQPQPQGNQPFEFVVTSNQDPNIFMSLEETERRQMILTEQIKSEVAQRTRTIRCVHYFNALMNQILIIWAFYIEMIKEPLDACYNNLATFQRMFQQYHWYVLCLILLISLPFILLMILWNKLKQQKQNYENQQILNELITKQKAIYRNDNVQGDQECGICLQAYCRNEELLILPCNQQHHFHMHCIKAWLILNFSCPKCRSKISEFRNA